MSKNYYQEINSALLFYEENKPYHTRDTEWICNGIDWCWKFRRIANDEMEELADRVCKVLDGTY